MIRAMLTKEFLLIFRDKQALLALFVMPAVFILIMSLALRDVFNEDRALINYAVVDLDHTAQSADFLRILSENKLLQKRADNASSDIQFFLAIPKGFMQEEGKALEVKAAVNIKQDLLALFKSQIISALVRARIAAFRASLEGLSLSMPKELEVVNFDESEMLHLRFEKMKRGERPNSTQQSVPTWIVFGMFFVIIPMSTIFIGERSQNTLHRLLAMNLSVPLLFGGKIIPYMLINQLQVWIMIAVGMFVVPLFGADALVLQGSVGALILVSLSLSLSAIGLSMLIATLVESVEQATTIGGILNILLGAIGGVMVPKFVMPDFMQTLSNISPMSWGLEGFLDILLRREGVEAVLPEVVALTLFGLVLLLLAALIFKTKIRRGI